MQLSDIATRQVVSVAPSDRLDKAIALMEEHNIHHLPVLDENVPAGMLSDRDVLTTIGWLTQKDRIDLHNGDLLGPRTVGEIMSTPVQALDLTDTIAHGAQTLLENGFSSVLLLDGGSAWGIAAEADFLKCFIDQRPLGSGSGWRFEKVADHMSANVQSARPNDTLFSAAKQMKEHRIRHLPVVHNGKLAGVVSDRDLHRALAKEWIESARGTWDEDEDDNHSPRRTNVREIMTRRVQTVGSHATLSDAADRMLHHKIGSLPIVDQGELVGVLTETDLLRALQSACSGLTT